MNDKNRYENQYEDAKRRSVSQNKNNIERKKYEKRKKRKKRLIIVLAAIYILSTASNVVGGKIIRDIKETNYINKTQAPYCQIINDNKHPCENFAGFWYDEVDISRAITKDKKNLNELDEAIYFTYESISMYPHKIINRVISSMGIYNEVNNERVGSLEEYLEYRNYENWEDFSYNVLKGVLERYYKEKYEKELEKRMKGKSL